MQEDPEARAGRQQVASETFHGDPADVRSIDYRDGELWFLDQTQLPERVIIERQESAEHVWDSIKQLKVRGAPAIGIAGAYGLVVGLRPYRAFGREAFLEQAKRLAAHLDGARPTAVNLSWALKRMLRTAEAGGGDGAELFAELEREARRIHREDIELCRAIGEHGRGLIRDDIGILTHCNAGRLATSDYGTATAPMYLAHSQGVRFRVYADESRPLLQGARLTSWELRAAGIDVTVITDNMAAFVMSHGLINLVLVGTDRVAANGDVANKIGTLGVAILAKHFGIPMYVACPSSTVDLATTAGTEIVIEERSPEEVTQFGLRRTTPEGVSVRNPAFDVTPNEIISGLITECGIIRPPYVQALREAFGGRAGGEC